MASSIVKIEGKPQQLVNDVQATFQLKRKTKISIPQAINMCLEKLLSMGIKAEDIIK